MAKAVNKIYKRDLYAPEPPKKEDTIQLVQGIMPDSIQEWWGSLALDKLGIEYKFQVPFFGGNYFPGGTIVDWLVPQGTIPTPLYFMGDYYHQGEQQEKDMLIAGKFALELKGQVAEPQYIWEHEASTYQQIFDKIKELFI